MLVLDDEPASLQSDEMAVASNDYLPLAGWGVLAIDVQSDGRDAIGAVLNVNGARVELAGSGAEALAVLSKTSPQRWPQVLLCDIVLNGENGYQVLERIRDFEARREIPAQQHMPAIALTGYTHTDDRDRARQAGFRLHLTKPVAAPALIEAIRGVACGQARGR